MAWVAVVSAPTLTTGLALAVALAWRDGDDSSPGVLSSVVNAGDPDLPPSYIVALALSDWIIRAVPVVAAAERMTDDAFVTTTDCDGMARHVQAAVRAYRDGGNV